MQSIDTKKIYESWKSCKPKQTSNGKPFLIDKVIYNRMFKEFQYEAIMKSIDKRLWKQLKTKLKKFYATFKSEVDI